jgi:hypothetical protein
VKRLASVAVFDGVIIDGAVQFLDVGFELVILLYPERCMWFCSI